MATHQNQVKTLDCQSLLVTATTFPFLFQGELKRLLRALTPKCHEVISECRVGRIGGGGHFALDGDACCGAVFGRAELTLRRGLCFVAEDLAEAVPKAAVAAQAAAAAVAAASEKGAKEEALWLFPGMGGGHTVR